MQVISLILGILAIIGMLIGFVPLLGALNWLNIPFAGVGIIFSAIAVGVSRGSKRMGMAALICCAIALFFGLIRLVLGGGIL